MNPIAFASKTKLGLGCGGALLLALACSHQPEPKMTPASGELTAPPAAPAPASAENTSGASLHLSEGVRRRCNLPDEPAEAPQFDFDEAELRPRGAGILDQVAECMQRGALKSEGVSIIGHADPRGSDAYNEQLGLRRADAARSYLSGRGVSTTRLTVESRGEQDASGTDPASWQLDRRIDIEETTPQVP